jgi:hypothetical protein
MYGSVLGAATTTGAIAALPNTGSSKVAAVITLFSLTVGIALIVVSTTRAISAKYFA